MPKMDINHSPKVQPAGSFLKLTMIQRPQSLHRTPRRKPAVTRRESANQNPCNGAPQEQIWEKNPNLRVHWSNLPW